MLANKQIHLKSRPDGQPRVEDFQLVTVDIPKLEQGQLLIKNLWMSVDPYMRGRMTDRDSYVPPFKLDRVLNGSAVGEVVESKNANFNAGDLVSHMSGWREYAISDGRYIEKLPPNTSSPQLYLGLLGTTGLTAYFGLLEVAALKGGETVFVSAAAGAVGSTAVQIARLKGCTVVATCGTDAKTRWLTEELGADEAINYKSCQSLLEIVRRVAPDGIDVYFDNVGGTHLEAALNSMKPFGRIAACGMIGAYNSPGVGDQVAESLRGHCAPNHDAGLPSHGLSGPVRRGSS